MTEPIEKPSPVVPGRDRPGGERRRYKTQRADHGVPPTMESLWNLTAAQPPTATEEPAIVIQTTSAETQEQENDPYLIDVPEGAVLSSGRFTQPGVLRQAAPKDSAFRIFSKGTPAVDGEVVSRYGKLYIKQPDGTLLEPPQELALLNHLNTRRRRVLPNHFKNANSAPIIPNFDKENFIF